MDSFRPWEPVALKKARYLNIATFRKNGNAVETPVWFAEEDDCFYIFSAGDAGKVKRLRNSPRSRVAACTATGRVTGDWVDTEADILQTEEDERRALEALRRKYGWQMWLTDLLSSVSGKMKKRAYIRARPLG